MALESLEARIEQREIRDLDNTHGDASTKTPYGERLLRADEIRLLVIERSAGTLRLRISLHKFEDDLQFDAISYVWGGGGSFNQCLMQRDGPCSDPDRFRDASEFESKPSVLAGFYMHQPARY